MHDIRVLIHEYRICISAYKDTSAYPCPKSICKTGLLFGQRSRTGGEGIERRAALLNAVT